jgi:hypothetical protein
MKNIVREKEKLERWFKDQGTIFFRVYDGHIEKGSKATPSFAQSDAEISVDDAWDKLHECLDQCSGGADYSIQLAANASDYTKPYKYFRLVQSDWSGRQAPMPQQQVQPVAVSGFGGIGAMEVLNFQQQSFNAQQALQNQLAEERQKAAILEMKLEQQKEKTKEAEKKNTSAIGTAIGEISKTPEAIPAIIQGLASLFQKNAPPPQQYYQQPPQYAAVAGTQGTQIVHQDTEEEPQGYDVATNLHDLLVAAGEDPNIIFKKIFDTVNFARTNGISAETLFTQLDKNKETLLKFIV